MDNVTLLNTLRQQASAEYQSRIPQATRTNLESVANALTTYTPSMNEFLSMMVNKIGLTIVRNKMAKNPLAGLKSGKVPYGKDIEEIIANPAISEKYSITSEDLLKNKAPDVKAIYYAMNRQDKYSVSINTPTIKNAIMSEGNLSDIINMIVSTLYSGDNIDEFILMKQLIKVANTNQHLNAQTFTWDLATMSKDNSEEIVKAIKTDSGLMKFPSKNFNAYSKVKPSTDSKADLTTFTDVSDQIILMDSRVLTNINVDVLASAFNMERVDFMQQVIEVDNFIDAPILALLCDKAWFNVKDNLYETSNMFIADTLTYKYYLHHWETIAYSVLANAKAYLYTPTKTQ